MTEKENKTTSSLFGILGNNFLLRSLKHRLHQLNCAYLVFLQSCFVTINKWTKVTQLPDAARDVISKMEPIQ